MSAWRRALLLSSLCGCSSAAPPVPEPRAIEVAATVAPPAPFDMDAFPRAVRAFREKNAPTFAGGIPGPTALGKDEQRASCDELVPRAKAHLDALKVTYRAHGECALDIAVSDLTNLGLVAKSLERTTKATTRYDVAFFFEKPFAAASYDSTARILYLPHDALYAPDSLTLAHELRHVAMHEARLRQDVALLEYQAVLTGDAFRPDALHVDEIYAYAGDILSLTGRLAKVGALDQAAVTRIHEDALAQRKPDPALLANEANAEFYRLELRLLTMRDHVLPALETLAASKQRKNLTITETTIDGITWARTTVETKKKPGALGGKVEIAIPAFVSDEELEAAMETPGNGAKPKREAVRARLVEQSFRMLERRLSHANIVVNDTMFPTLAAFVKTMDPAQLEAIGDMAEDLQKPIPRSMDMLDVRL